MSLADATLTGDAVMHDAPAVSDYGPIYGPILVGAAWLIGWATELPTPTVDAIDRFFIVGMHGAMFAVSMFGAYKTFAPGATRLWHTLRRRPR